MSKYTRLNKINHYHDRGSTKITNKTTTNTARLLIEEDEEQEEATNCQDRLAPIKNSSSNQTTTNRKMEARKILESRKRNSSSIITKVKMPGQLLFNYRNNNNCSMRRLAFIALSVSTIMMMLFVLLISVDGVYSLNCYHCSSADNPGCDESFTGMANITETDCEKHINQPAKVCRKIVQYIEKKKVVIRSCGFIDEHADKEHKPMCHKRSGTFAIMMESCSCYTDNCNHSASLVPNQSVLILASSSLVVLTFYYLLQKTTSLRVSSERQR